MISKVFPGHHFYHAVRYVCKEEKKPEILATEGVRAHDYRLMAQDFINQHELRPSKKQACFHSVLSFHPTEKPDNATLVEIAKKYLEGIGITNTQYAIVKHTEKAHLHVHVIANMVNNDGKSIRDNWIALKGKRLAQKLTDEYKLIPALRKDLTLTNLEALSESEANKYKVYIAISESLPLCTTMEELEWRLQKRGIETQYKYKGQTSEKQGVSFRIGTDCFKGSKIDRQFSLGNLQKSLGLKQHLVEEIQHSEEEFTESQAGNKGQKLIRAAQALNHRGTVSNSGTGGKQQSNEMQKEVEKLFEKLLTAEPAHEEDANIFLIEQRRHRKKPKHKIRR
jgi:hypothetical protein